VVRQTYEVAAGAGLVGHLKCPTGKVSVGGGVYGFPGFVVDASYPVADPTNAVSSWELYGRNTGGKAQSLYVYAVCVSK